MHAEAFKFVRDCLAELPPRRRVVELGGLDINGSVRDLFDGVDYISVDLVDGPGVDVVADAAHYQPVAEPDTVLCCEVLEHARRADLVVSNAIRMLGPGGALILTCASPPRQPHSGIDGGTVRPGEWYRNVPLADLARWLEGTEVRHLEWHDWRGDLHALAVKA